MKKNNDYRELSDFLVHSSRIVLADVVGNLQNLNGYGTGTHGDFNTVAHLDIIAGLDHPAIDADASIVAGLVGYGAALDEAGYLQILV